MFSFPLECFVCRDVIKNTFFEETKNEKFVHFAVTIALSIATVSLSFLTDCLGVVLEINVTFIVIFLVFLLISLKFFFFKKGALIATTLGYVMPSLCAIVINFNDEKSFKAAVKPLIILTIGIDRILRIILNSTDSKFYYFFSRLSGIHCWLNFCCK